MNPRIWVIRHSLELLLLAATVYAFSLLLKYRDRLRLKWQTALIFSALHTIVGVLAVRAFAFMESGFNSSAGGNMSLFGGIFAMPVFYFVFAKLKKLPAAEVFDVFTPVMVFTVMCARVNCLIGGCCTGKEIFAGKGLLYPTRELEIIFYVVFLAVVLPRLKKGRTDGELYPAYMFSYGVFRFIIEFMRDNKALFGIFHISHIWAATAAIIGFSSLAYLKRSKRTKVRKKIKES